MHSKSPPIAARENKVRSGTRRRCFLAQRLSQPNTKKVVNYGFIPNTISGDGEELDAYVLGVDTPLANFTGKCVAIIHRTNDNDDKLIVVPDGQNPTNEYIEQKTAFQEQWFKHTIIR